MIDTQFAFSAIQRARARIMDTLEIYLEKDPRWAAIRMKVLRYLGDKDGLEKELLDASEK